MFQLALKQLIAKKKQSFLILTGIGLGCMLFVAISAVQLGFREFMIKALLNNTAHIIIRGSENIIDQSKIESILALEGIHIWHTPPHGKRDESRLDNYLGWYNILKKDSRVYDFSPRLSTNVMLKKGALKENIALIGSLPEKQVRISDIQDYVVEGSFLNLKSAGNKILLGQEVARNLGVTLNQTIDVIAATGEVYPFKVVGMTSFGDKRTDASMGFAHIHDVQKVNQSPGRISEIAVSLYQLEDAQEVASLWDKFTEDKVEDWKSANQMFMEMIKMQDIVRYFIMFSVLVVASFGIYNVLSIMINQKRQEIAILRSIGFGPLKILELILLQGLILGVLGGALGICLGYFVSLLVESIELDMNLGGSNHLFVSYDFSIYSASLLASIFASFLASLIPAFQASRMTPIDIIRGVHD